MGSECLGGMEKTRRGHGFRLAMPVAPLVSSLHHPFRIRGADHSNLRELPQHHMMRFFAASGEAVGQGQVAEFPRSVAQPQPVTEDRRRGE